MSASDSPRVSESFLAVAWIALMFLWFSSEEIIAMNMSSPSVVLPRTSIFTRGEGGQGLEVRDDLPVVGELPVRSDLKTDALGRGRNLRAQRARGEEERRQRGTEHERHRLLPF